MMDFLRRIFWSNDRSSKISTTENIADNSPVLHGEDPGSIPPVEDSNPLVDDERK